MSILIPQNLLNFINDHKKFIIAGHKEPDGDCVGSQLALASVIKRLGKEIVVCSAGPFKRTEISVYKDRFISAIGERERQDAAVIVVDCLSVSRTGDVEESLKGLPIAVIDHHEGRDHCAGTRENPLFIEPNAPSTTCLILTLIEAMGFTPTEEEAKLLFFGLCTDTGFFRHVDSTGSETFAYASRLINGGASPKEAFRLINGGKTLAARQLLGILLARSQSYFDGKLIITTEEYHETQHFGLESRDSDSLYQLLQTIHGVEAIVVIRQETPAHCSVGLRSQDKINVSKIAAAFGGGGHKNAAGLSIKGTIETVRAKLVAAFEQFF
ncbi:MAG: bifunctional oligoribonuclease/PAP phosphatase NrnA [Treponema sp.]|jgi:phosphoesterase RecJ-like protein|nr:bifunctional oligoribonuclease/PAP phosphatase NrnA [Treponema sp.]